jgi:dienelactone hydrolase
LDEKDLYFMKKKNIWIKAVKTMTTILALGFLLFPSPSSIAFTTTVFIQRSKGVSQISQKAKPMEWADLAGSVLASEALVTSVPRLAKDSNYAGAVQQIWKQELRTKHVSEFCRHCYEADDGRRFYGTLIRRKKNEGAITKIPGLVFFHTAAGPHDVCLQWRADSLVTNQDAFPDGCIILIADILGDDNGWAWSSDRTRYNAARDLVLTQDGAGTRIHLQSTIMAAINALKCVPEVDESRLAALGWCLGGHPVLELGRMKIPEMKAMVTFHGVFDGILSPKSEIKVGGSRVLICNGADDPFVPKEALSNAVATLQRYGHCVEVLNLEGARHGFTNPAQDFNSNEAFAYNDKVAKTVWMETVSLLKSEFHA